MELFQPDIMEHLINISGNSMETNPIIPEEFLSSGFLAGNVGAPFVIGFAVGYFAKKVLRTVLLLGGAAIVLLFVADHFQVVNLSEAMLQQATTTATDTVKSSSDFLMERLGNVTAKGISATTGFLLGFKQG